MSDSSIEWTDKTWNPVAGCSIESSGCTNCYAMRMAARLEAMGVKKYQGLTRKSGGRAVWTGNINCDESTLIAPTAWKKPRNVFVNSMSDLFHPDVPFDFVERVWGVMKSCPQHTFQILTKRPNRMAEFTDAKGFSVLPNVWLGTSVENANAVERIEMLKNVRTAIRFVSFEPLIGPVGELELDCIHWAIIGGESGPGSRPMKEEWLEEIEKQCRKFQTAFFFKQWGGSNKKSTGRHYKGRVWSEYPQHSPA